MSLKNYLMIIGISTLICWLSCILVIVFINPYQTGWLSFMFFYASLFLALIGTFSLLGFGLRFLMNKNEILYKQVNIASRQAVLLALLVVSICVLQSQRLLFWWNIIVLVFLVTLVEVLLILKKKHS